MNIFFPTIPDFSVATEFLVALSVRGLNLWVVSNCTVMKCVISLNIDRISTVVSIKLWFLLLFMKLLKIPTEHVLADVAGVLLARCPLRVSKSSQLEATLIYSPALRTLPPVCCLQFQQVDIQVTTFCFSIWLLWQITADHIWTWLNYFTNKRTDTLIAISPISSVINVPWVGLEANTRLVSPNKTQRDDWQGAEMSSLDWTSSSILLQSFLDYLTSNAILLYCRVVLYCTYCRGECLFEDQVNFL